MDLGRSRVEPPPGTGLYDSIKAYIACRRDSGKWYAGSRQAFKKAFGVNLYEVDREMKAFYFSD